jgi:hypothetical protein
MANCSYRYQSYTKQPLALNSFDYVPRKVCKHDSNCRRSLGPYTLKTEFTSKNTSSHCLFDSGTLAQNAEIIIKLRVSTRETPVMQVVAVGQIGQDYFNRLPFKPATIPRLPMKKPLPKKFAPPARVRKSATCTICRRSPAGRSCFSEPPLT